MKILVTTVKQTSAIDIIAKGVIKHNPHHDIKMLPVHPKRPSNETLHEWQKLAGWADILDFRYWKNAVMLLAMFPEVRNKPKILCHYNPYDINKEKWENFNIVTVPNSSIQSLLPIAEMVPLTINLDFFKFNQEYTKEKTVGMSVSRIEGKKGVLEVAQACKALKYKFILVGRVSEPTYMKAVAEAAGEYLDFRDSVTDEELVKAYQETAVHVCNSEDNFESGTLPILEAMAMGVPVLTRDIGHVPDLNNGKNMVVRKGKKGDLEDLKTELKDLMEAEIRRKTIRDKAWETAKIRDERKTALMYDKMWHRVISKDKPLVSIIVPTANRPEILIESLGAVLVQDYPAKEIIVCDDGVDIRTKKVVDEYKKHFSTPIKYIKTDNPKIYGLATARNLGIVESIGEVLMFCDDRLKMEQGAIQAFIDRVGAKKWVWGVKDGHRKGFVENFSAVKRIDLVNGGMFNERVTSYGGTTQDIRRRFEKGQSFAFELVPEAKATAIAKSSSKWQRKESIIKSKTLLWKLYDQK